MRILVKRIAKKSTYTIGKLYVDGKYVCDTLEDKDRNLNQSMSLSEIKKLKVYGQTAIPTGTYKVNMNIESPSFGKKEFYKQVCKGKLPRLMNVPGYEGVLIHVGDGPRGAELTQGCILVGENKIVGQLVNGKETFKKLYNMLKGNIEITIE